MNFKKDKKIILLIFILGLVGIFFILNLYNYNKIKNIENSIKKMNNTIAFPRIFPDINFKFKKVKCTGYFDYTCNIQDINLSYQKYFLGNIKEAFISPKNHKFQIKEINFIKDIKENIVPPSLDNSFFPLNISGMLYKNYLDFDIDNKLLNLKLSSKFKIISSKPYKIILDNQGDLKKGNNGTFKEITINKGFYIKINNLQLMITNKNLPKYFYELYKFNAKKMSPITLNQIYFHINKKKILSFKEFKNTIQNTKENSFKELNDFIKESFNTKNNKFILQLTNRSNIKLGETLIINKKFLNKYYQITTRNLK